MKGLGTALITPFTEEGKVDFPALSQLIEHQVAGGTDYLVILGTTSEVPTLTHQEQNAIIDYVVKQVAGRMPLVLGIGGNSTAAVVERIDELKEQLVAHFAAILSVTPYYNRPQQEGLYQHFCAVAEASFKIFIFTKSINLFPASQRCLLHCVGYVIIIFQNGFRNFVHCPHLLCHKPLECMFIMFSCLSYQ